MDLTCMVYDDTLWEVSQNMFKALRKRVVKEEFRRAVGELVLRHGGKESNLAMLHLPECGSFNICVRVSFQDGSSVMLRFPVRGQVMVPDEKLRVEVATMQFIRENTGIPVPRIVYFSGDRAESPPGVGSFIIMDYVEHEEALYEPLQIPGTTADENPTLCQDIEETKLKKGYTVVAEFCLQLFQPAFAQIGSLAQTGETQWNVTERPLTYNMNELLMLGGLPSDSLPKSPLKTASSYYCALADLHMEHLTWQYNDAVDSAHDCRRKYVARCLFRNLAYEGKLDQFPEFEHGPFRLFCEDLRASNFLLDKDMTLSGVVDWEFTIAAPAGFAISPPWWLLLEHPLRWPRGLAHWEKQFERRLETFLEVLHQVEKAAVEKGELSREAENFLSTRMRRSWDSGAFWIDYAAQRSWDFDQIFFNRLDMKFFGEMEEGADWLAARLALLTEEQREGMEPFVEMKLAQKADRKVVDYMAERFKALELRQIEPELETVTATEKRTEAAQKQTEENRRLGQSNIQEQQSEEKGQEQSNDEEQAAAAENGEDEGSKSQEHASEESRNNSQ